MAHRAARALLLSPPSAVDEEDEKQEQGEKRINKKMWMILL